MYELTGGLRGAFALGLLAFALALSACSGEGRRLAHATPLISVQGRDARGRVVQLPRRPERVAALGSAAAEASVVLGAGSRLVAVSERISDAHWHWPLPNVLRLSDRGGMALADLRSLGLDLVLVDEGMYRPETLEGLERSLGVPVFALSTRPLDALPEGWRELSRILGLPEAGDSLAAEAEAALQRLRRSAEGQTPYAALLLLPPAQEGGPPQALGGRSTLNGLAQATAVKTAYADRPFDRVEVTPDSILRLAPEWIVLLGTSDQFFLSFLSSDERLQQLPAVQSNRVILLPDEQLLHYGPSLIYNLALLLKIFHPNVTVAPPALRPHLPARAWTAPVADSTTSEPSPPAVR